MNFNIGSIVGTLELKDRGWKGNVRSAIADTNRLKSSLESISTSARNVALGAGALGGAILGTAGSMLKAAAAMQEGENLFEVSMGGMADSTRKWSEEMARALGLNASGVRENVATLNVMLNSMGFAEEEAASMSKTMTQLAYDMSSFYNLAPTEAFDKLRAGLSGEAEPLKKLGIIINETTVNAYALEHGLLKAGQELSETAKVAARFGLIMEATAKAQGDLLRTSDSATNQTRRFQAQILGLREEIGTKLLPAYTSLIKATNMVLDGTLNFIAAYPDLTSLLASGTVTIGGAATAVAGMSTAVYGLTKSLQFLRATAAVTWAVMGGPLTVAAGLAVAALGGIAFAAYSLRVAFKEEFDRMWDAAEVLIIALPSGFNEAFAWIGQSLVKFAAKAMNIFLNLKSAMDKVFDPEATWGDVKDALTADSSGLIEGLLTMQLHRTTDELKETVGNLYTSVKDGSSIFFTALKAQFGEDMEALQAFLAERFPGVLAQIEQAALESANTTANNLMGEAAGAAGASAGAGSGGAQEGKPLSLETVGEPVTGLGIVDDERLLRQIDYWDQLMQVLDPVQSMLLQIGQDLQAVQDFGRMDDETASLLAADYWRSMQSMSNEAIESIVNQVRKDFPKMADDLDKLFEKKKVEDWTGSVSNAGSHLMNIGSSLSRLPGKWGKAGQAAMAAARVMQAAGAISKGIWGMVELAVMAVVEAIGLMGDESEESKSEMDLLMEDLASATEDWADQMTDAIVEFVRTGKLEIKDFVDSVIDDLLRIGISNLVVNPMVDWLAGAFAKGGAFKAGQVVPFAKGGSLVGGPTPFPMAGGKVGLMGEAGPEAIMPLERMNDGKLGVRAEGGGNQTVVNIIDQRTNAPAVQTKERMDGGRRILDVYIVDTVREALLGGDLDLDMALAFGAGRRGA